MKRKFLLIFVLCFVAVCSLLSFTACNSDNKNDSGVTEPPTTEPDPSQHTHSYGEWIVTKSATCTDEGSQSRYCSCGEVQTTSIGALGHSIQSHEAKAATCTEKGWKAYDTCSRCDYTTYEEIDALGHSIQSHEAKAATCTERGWKTYDTCSRCDYTTYEEIDALGHNFTGKYINNSTFHWRVCLNGCGETGGTGVHKFNSKDSCSECGYSVVYTPNLAYTLSEDGTYYVLSGIGDAVETYIRALPSVNGKPVREVAENAFTGNTKITELYLPESVTKIGAGAFENCSSLSSVYLFDKYTLIGKNAFSGTAYFNERANWIDNALYIGANLISVRTTTLGTSKIKGGTALIADGAYSGCANIIGLEIPDSVKFIGNNAFDGCTSIESITINEDVVCNAKLNSLSSLKRANVPVNLTSFLPNSLQELTVTGIGEISGYACSNFTSLKTVVINDGVTAIGCGAFKGCNSLLQMTLPFIGNSRDAKEYKSVFGYIFGYTTLTLTEYKYDYDSYKTYNGAINQYIIYEGEYANGKKYTKYFYNIPTGLQSVIITGDKLPRNAFCNCDLTDISLFGAVTDIAYMSFYGCSKLSNFTIPDGVTSIDYYAFNGCSSLKSITIPDGVTYIDSDAFSNCRSLTSVTIPNSVTSIGSYAFYNCSGLKSLTISDGVNSIGSYAFYKCSGLTSLTIPDSVTSIGRSAFSGCNSLIQTENGIQYVDRWVVYCSNSVTEVYLRNNTKGIAREAFSGCGSLTSVTIPDSVTFIGSSAFSGCGSLQTVYYKGTEESWSKISIATSNNDLTGAEIIYC